MKDSWERIEAPLSLDDRQINEIVRSAFPNKRVLYSERIGIGLRNSNYKIVVDGFSEPFVLRIYRGNTEIADKEIDIARFVGGRVPIAKPLFADTSCTMFTHRPDIGLNPSSPLLVRFIQSPHLHKSFLISILYLEALRNQRV